MGIHLIGVHLMGIHFMGMHPVDEHLTDMYLLGVYLIDVHLTGVYIFPNLKRLWGNFQIPCLTNGWLICQDLSCKRLSCNEPTAGLPRAVLHNSSERKNELSEKTWKQEQPKSCPPACPFWRDQGSIVLSRPTVARYDLLGIV